MAGYPERKRRKIGPSSQLKLISSAALCVLSSVAVGNVSALSPSSLFFGLNAEAIPMVPAPLKEVADSAVLGGHSVFRVRKDAAGLNRMIQTEDDSALQSAVAGAPPPPQVIRVQNAARSEGPPSVLSSTGSNHLNDDNSGYQPLEAIDVVFLVDLSTSAQEIFNTTQWYAYWDSMQKAFESISDAFPGITRFSRIEFLDRGDQGLPGNNQCIIPITDFVSDPDKMMSNRPASGFDVSGGDIQSMNYDALYWAITNDSTHGAWAVSPSGDPSRVLKLFVVSTALSGHFHGDSTGSQYAALDAWNDGILDCTGGYSDLAAWAPAWNSGGFHAVWQQMALTTADDDSLQNDVTRDWVSPCGITNVGFVPSASLDDPNRFLSFICQSAPMEDGCLSLVQDSTSTESTDSSSESVTDSTESATSPLSTLVSTTDSDSSSDSGETVATSTDLTTPSTVFDPTAPTTPSTEFDPSSESDATAPTTPSTVFDPTAPTTPSTEFDPSSEFDPTAPTTPSTVFDPTAPTTPTTEFDPSSESGATAPTTPSTEFDPTAPTTPSTEFDPTAPTTPSTEFDPTAPTTTTQFDPTAPTTTTQFDPTASHSTFTTQSMATDVATLPPDSANIPLIVTSSVVGVVGLVCASVGCWYWMSHGPHPKKGAAGQTAERQLADSFAEAVQTGNYSSPLLAGAGAGAGATTTPAIVEDARAVEEGKIVAEQSFIEPNDPWPELAGSGSGPA